MSNGLFVMIVGRFSTVYGTDDNYLKKVKHTFVPDDDVVCEDAARRLGYLPVEFVNGRPDVPSGMKMVRKVSVLADRVTKEYMLLPLNEAVPADVPGPRRWSRLNLKRTLESAGKWDDAKSAMEAIGIYDEFMMCNYISESDPSFVIAYEWACEAFGKDAVDAILDAIPEEP